MKSNHKLKICLFILFGISNSLYAQNTSTEDFFYQRGYENGFSSGYEQGVKEAFLAAKDMLKNYQNELKAYEIGKYLIKNQNLTYPQVWQEIDDNGLVKLRVLPSKIEKEINIDELFAKYASIPQIKPNINQNLESNINEKNSVQLSYRDSNINKMPQKVSQLANKKTLSVEKNSRNLDILKKANVVFSDEGTSYQVLFFTNTEKQNFCEEFQICK
ncbi:hypothetical protein [Campylobacter jejuni]|uniref:hypothetical protein n=1 Tax=Campylobacter jejuni TaxID=197 RepID=UPI000F806292|nr:hypothetical protein [Campylobacter jejuni]RTJ13532.1 hypothetical protein C3H92_01300 [Campylobacter jejuni]RTJ42002.1 hypothetical protein C3H73_06345 [Campylobacter jejuni]